MKRCVLVASMEGMIRVMWTMLVSPDATELSGGMYAPSPRNDLIFDIRSSEDADGESSMIGSARFALPCFGCDARAIFEGCAGLALTLPGFPIDRAVFK